MTTDLDLHATAFFLADHASVENGKVYANGAFFNRMNFATFPASATITVVAVLNVPWSDYDRPHTFTVRFENADGQPLAGEFEGQFEVSENPEMRVGDPTVMPLTVTVTNLMFPSVGDYAVVLYVDGEEISRWSFRVVQVMAV